MMTYNIAATVKGEDEKTYGTEIQVEGPASLDEFVSQLGQAGTLEVLQRDFRQDQQAILRGRIAAKIGKESGTSGGRLANAVRVDLN